MSQAAILAAIGMALTSVEGVGQVHTRERWTANWPRFLDLFKASDNAIRGWMVNRTSTAQRQATIGQVELAHVFTLRAVHGLQDATASETAFQAHLDAVRVAFKSLDTLGGACDTLRPDWGPMSGLSGLQIDRVENRLFGDVLCHFAECRLCALELETD